MGHIKKLSINGIGETVEWVQICCASVETCTGSPSIMITSALPALEGRQGDVWVCWFTRVVYQRASTAVKKACLFLKKKKTKNHPGKQRRYMPLASVCICGHTQIIKTTHSPGYVRKTQVFL